MAYASLSEMRAEEGLDDSVTFPDADVTAAVAQAEIEIDRFCFTSFEYKTFSVILDGNGKRSIMVRDDEGYPILFLRTLSGVTIDADDGLGAVAQTTTGWGLYPEGLLVRPDETFDCHEVGRNVAVAGTAGLTATPDAVIKWCARKLARFHLLDGINRVDDRALSMQTDFGNIMLSHASNNPERPTALPEVNARLAKYRQMSGGAFT